LDIILLYTKDFSLTTNIEEYDINFNFFDTKEEINNIYAKKIDNYIFIKKHLLLKNELLIIHLFCIIINLFQNIFDIFWIC